jgi:hypothetical protein
MMPKKKLMKSKLEKMLLESANQALAIAKGEIRGRVTIRKTVALSLPKTPNNLYLEFF